MRVFMYWNLHRNCWSLKALMGQNKGRVIAHASSVELKRCIFSVSQAGRARVIREQRKNVHAGIIGVVVGIDALPGASDSLRQLPGVSQGADGVRVTYNPYKGPDFVSVDLLNTPMHKAPRVVANGRNVIACH